ncbi:glycosyltransferase family 4 protein [Imperialibacter roseus]|uniref:Glycosyltransferase family 4 protein n=1 Tax=Imperialibacter roseus TaxID=1324217 RepID=A0ABZ0IHR7_9BACT|nr:glycosyltransferase family 4 protein [Imperialibacter roseus]WOK04201.1 glycosyltransferase family 4 protein [Imperialibacter roseus]
MKVAILSPIAWRTPPRKYGPWEQVASNIAEGLLKKGIDVTLFATGDSTTSGQLESVCEHPYAEDQSIDPKVWECLHISHLMEQASCFDIIHNHFDFLPLTYSRLIDTPMITTIHGFSSPKIVPVYKKYNASTAYISISNADRHPELDYLGTIYHGLNPEDFTFKKDKKHYLLYFGRIHPDKGAHAAIEIARRAGVPLIMAGLIQDQQYYETAIKPSVESGQVRYLGNVGPIERSKLLSEAMALLHPIFFDEPFGLSVVEAMMCGTPAIAYDRGSMPELIVNGVTGFLVRDVTEAVGSVALLAQLDPLRCREHAKTHFSTVTMVEAYIRAYEMVLHARS